MPAAKQLPLGGDSVTELLRRLLAEAGTPLEAGPATAAKEAHARVLDSADEAAAAAADAGAAPLDFTLPDGAVLRLPAAPFAACGELLFEPSACGARSCGLASLLMESIQSVIPDQRRTLLEGVVLSGGGGALRGTSSRLVRDLTAAAPSHVRPAAVAPPEYMHSETLRYAPFVGGCILAKTVFTLNQFMSRADYEENGPTYRGR